MSTLRAESAPSAVAVRDVVHDEVTGWGGGDLCPAWRWSPDRPEVLADALRAGHGHLARGAIPRGMGRSYGDAAQRRDGTLLDTRRWRRLELDATDGIATAEAGITLGELLAAVIGAGWILPVVPGTQHVTVGGAIASDIHGKNHGTLGTFGRHVEAIGLLTADGELRELHRGGSDALFEATLGGMGLTGVITWARIRLRRVTSASLAVDTDRAAGLDEVLALLVEPGGEHRVAWLDLLGGPEGRGVVTRASHVEDGPLSPRAVSSSPLLRVPRGFPGALLRPEAVRTFNALRYHRAPRSERGHVEPFGGHMFPLDGLDAWPRLYGRRGFVQYQLVVPRGEEDVLREVLRILAAADVPCYLAVLKDFGPEGDGIISFPMEGWTLALDLPRAAEGLAAALDRCDERVAAAGGRVYLSKDARVRPATLEAMYPRLAEWRAVRDAADPQGVWRSDLAVRTGLVGER